MEVVRRTRFEKKYSILGTIQQILASIIILLFIIGLIPLQFGEIFPLLIILIGIQMFLSLIRLKIINFILEFFILILAMGSLVPFLGYIPRIIGIFAGLLDLVSLNAFTISKIVSVKKFKKKRNPNARDADFKEK